MAAGWHLACSYLLVQDSKVEEGFDFTYRFPVLATMASPLLALLTLLLASAGLVLEDGYTVTTAVDHNPVPAVPHPYARTGNLVLLNSVGSTLYNLALPLSGFGAGFQILAGGGLARRGSSTESPTMPPSTARSFAVDNADNANVADRKIPPSGLGTTSVSIIAVLCALLGSVIGFSVRHFYPAHEVSINRFFRRMRMQYKTIQRTATLISFSDIIGVAANSTFRALLLKLVRVSLGYPSVVFPSVGLEKRGPVKPGPSLLDLDYPVITSTDPDNKADASTEPVGNFIGFDGDTSSEEDNEPASDDKEPAGELVALLDGPELSSKKIDDMIEGQLIGLFRSRE